MSQHYFIYMLHDLYHVALLVNSEIKVLQTRKSLREHIKAQATTTLLISTTSNTSIFTIPKLYIITSYIFILTRILLTISKLAIKRESTPALTLTCFNYFQTSYMARDYLVLKHITNIKELEKNNELIEANINNMPGNKNIQEKTSFQVNLKLILQKLI